MRGFIGVLSVCGGLLALSCSTTDYALYLEDDAARGLGGAAPLGNEDTLDGSGGSKDSGGSPVNNSGGDSTSGGSASGGSSLGGSESALCDDTNPPSESMPIRIRSPQLDLCFSQGNPEALMGNSGFALTLVPCDNAPERLWIITKDEVGAFKFENVNSRFNLDVRFADSEPGTPFVLYGSHALYNQRFIALTGANQSLQLAPRHTRGMCAEAQGTEVRLELCDPYEPAQFFELTDCSIALE